MLSLPTAQGPGGLGALVEQFERQMLACSVKKKRREHFKELLKVVELGRGGAGGGDGAGGGPGSRGVVDIRRRMTVRFAPSPVKDGGGGVLGAGGDFDLSAFFGD